MLFTEVRFLFFFALVFSVHWLLRRNGLRKAWLLLVSYAFYAAWDYRFLSLIWISTLVDFIAGSRLGLGPKGVEAMEMSDHFGQTTRLRFSDITLNPKLDPAAFQFTPPKGADVLGER